MRMLFEEERWQNAISKGVDKDINRGELYRLCKPEVRAELYRAIRDGKYEITPPHTARIPKDTPGEYRTVYINEPMDRVLLGIINDLLLELTPDMVHKSCVSYQKGIGCGRIVQDIAGTVAQSRSGVIGFKSDLSKYFDSVPIEYIYEAFDEVEYRHGRSAVLDVLRNYYGESFYFDEHDNLIHHYQSLKQGCAVASWLANVLLYHIDDRLSSLADDMGGVYVRYSDDMLYIGKCADDAMRILCEELDKMNMKLNPDKVEYIRRDRWFKFLGFSIKGGDISLSRTRIKNFQREIEKRTIRKRGQTLKSAVDAVNRFLYRGDGCHSWATLVLPTVNVRSDIDKLNAFVMDALRAVQTGRDRIGGLGYIATQEQGCVDRGTGQHVKTNRERTEKRIEGYLTLGCMQNAIKTRRGAYDALVDTL